MGSQQSTKVSRALLCPALALPALLCLALPCPALPCPAPPPPLYSHPLLCPLELAPWGPGQPCQVMLCSAPACLGFAFDVPGCISFALSCCAESMSPCTLTSANLVYFLVPNGSGEDDQPGHNIIYKVKEHMKLAWFEHSVKFMRKAAP